MKSSASPKRRPSVLVADADPEVREALSTCLIRQGYPVVLAGDGATALEQASRHPLGLALLEMRLPGPSGMELLRQLKCLRPGLEAILIAAHSSIPEAVEAMHQGAFYYLLKPLDLELLQQKIEQAWVIYQERTQIQIGELYIDLQEAHVTLKGKPAKLTQLEYHILACLAQRRDQVVSYQVLRQEAWGCNSGVESNTIWTAVHRLRDKIGRKYITSFKSRGYLLQAPESIREGDKS